MGVAQAVPIVFLCLYFPVPIIMLWLHALSPVWTRLGAWSYGVHAPVYAALVALTASTHRWIALGAWPWHVGWRVGGGLLVVAALVLIALSYGRISPWTAMAGPQITRSPRRALVTDGVYGTMRHPRYAALLLGSLGNFLLTGYPLLLAAFVVTSALTGVLVRVEDRELEESFGRDYRDYRSRVPAFPGLRASRSRYRRR